MDEYTELTLNSYDKNAKVYDRFSFLKNNQFEINLFVSRLKGKKVLDIGCGTGRDILQFLDLGLKPVGIDISNEIIKLARKNAKKADFRQMDMRNLLFRKDSFDGIWCNESLIHIPKSEIVKILEEFRRVLKKEGIIYVSLIEGEGERRKKDKEVNRSPRFFSFYTQTEFEQILIENDFEIVSANFHDLDGTNYIDLFFTSKIYK